MNYKAPQGVKSTRWDCVIQAILGSFNCELSNIFRVITQMELTLFFLGCYICTYAFFFYF